jgi:hypothetical protein
MQNGSDPIYRKVHYSGQFILPLAAAFVLFHKFFPHPTLKNMFDVYLI